MKLRTAVSLPLGIAAWASATAFADGTTPTINSGDTAWLLVSSAMVLLMTPALAFFYGGMVRNKNVVATIMQSFIACAVVTVAWFVCGYTMAFGPSMGGMVGGFDWAFLNGVGTVPNADYGATVPHSLFMIFQCMFAIITPALISGAFAERMKFNAYLAFIVAWSILIYAPLAHWVWGVGGMLRTQGALDFAGGLVVHLSAGASALAAALAIGKRSDYGKADNTPSNIPLVVVGTGMLWFGWFGFNGGSAIGSNELATTALTNTHFAAAAATLSWMLVDWFFKGKPSLLGCCIGAVVGLIAVTPASGFVSTQSALFIGLVAGAAANFVAVWRAKSQIDDSLDVFACHGVGGAIGVLMTGLFASKAINAAGADGSGELFFTQLKSVGIVGVFCFVGTFVILKAINALIGLRPNQSDEQRGLDASEHNEKAAA
jgi:Amt family ammonium transporter